MTEAITEPGTIIRLAAKGDGLTYDGRHASGAAPGDVLQADGSLVRGPHYQIPPCQHFERCGGCQLQHVDDDALTRFVGNRVAFAAESQELEPDVMTPVHLSPPQSRRRASMLAMNVAGRPRIGFREAGSHKLVDLQECHILRPELMALVAPLRAMLAKRSGRYSVNVEMVLTDQGVDCVLKNIAVEGLAETEAMLDFARDNNLARLTLDQGYGPETVWEPNPVTVTLSGVPVGFPAGAFLQATQDGEDTLVAAVKDWLSNCATVADLFSGLGTFAFALAGKKTKVLAVEAARDSHLACKTAAGRARLPVHSMHRDLFRNPLEAAELSKLSAVLLDPPRAGARDQVAQIAASSVERVVYISCNPSSWARDAKALVEAGFKLRELRPVGQFRWSIHVELASLFQR